MDITSWQNLLEDHHTLLNKHLETMALMRQYTEAGTSGAQTLQSCVEQTESLAQSFKMLAYKFMAELQSRNHSQPAPANGSHSSTIRGGISGPTPAEQVLQGSAPQRTVIRTKRKAPGQDPTPIDTVVSTTEAPRKRPRPATSSRSGTATPGTYETRSTSSSQPPQQRAEEEDDDDDDDSFLRAVQAKLKGKAERIGEGMVKKRKRNSDNSDTVLEPAARRPTTNSKPRKKMRQTITQIEAEAELERNYTPQQEMQPNKRSSPATEYMESILRRADIKRQRATRSTGMSVG